MKYRVGPNPTWAGADLSARFSPGSVVAVDHPVPDHGDVRVRRFGPDGCVLPYSGGYLAVSCLEPIEDDEVPRDDARDECDALPFGRASLKAALVAVGHDPAQVLRIAQAIEDAR